jgi:phosphopantothenoylcysteine decarboxylase/phosphopantothenate--cysteine ligase
MMFKGKKILLAITGSIAAYKSILLLRLLVKEGAEIKVIVTPAAKDFVPTLTLSTLSKHQVLCDLFDENSWANHVMLGRWADIMVIAPASCNSIAKMAYGHCDNLFLATYLSATCPVVVAPAMDEDMWKHPATRENISRLQSHGNYVIPVESGELASGLVGDGRMAEPESIVDYLGTEFFSAKDLRGKHAIVTAGPTYEAIDPVRFIGNHSSGKMGLAVSKELAQRGAQVELILGPSSLDVNYPGVHVQKVKSAEEMYAACIDRFDHADIAVLAAAVADFTPAEVSVQKIKKTQDSLVIELKKTTDILKTLGQRKKNGQILVGFALETENERDYAIAKLKEKNADLIVLNSLRDEGAGFGYDTNKITIFDRYAKEQRFERKPKQQVAKDIVDSIIKLVYE